MVFEQCLVFSHQEVLLACYSVTRARCVRSLPGPVLPTAGGFLLGYSGVSLAEKHSWSSKYVTQFCLTTQHTKQSRGKTRKINQDVNCYL